MEISETETLEEILAKGIGIWITSLILEDNTDYTVILKRRSRLGWKAITAGYGFSLSDALRDALDMLPDQQP